jgi:hypothetical protein
MSQLGVVWIRRAVGLSAVGLTPATSQGGNGESRPKAALSSKVSRRRLTLPPRLQGSTIGAGRLNFRVRNGTGCFPSAMATETALPPSRQGHDGAAGSGIR